MKRLVTILTLVVLSLTCLGGDLSSRTVRTPTDTGRMKVKVLRPKQTDAPVPGILWIHGGGYMLGGLYGSQEISKYASPGKSRARLPSGAFAKSTNDT